MALNKLAGRSFNDLMQYPIFPFILSDYISSSIDLNSPSVFRFELLLVYLKKFYSRNLSKPMAIQNAKMESVYSQNYQCLAEEFEKQKKNLTQFSSVRFGPYHYGSHYSNTGIVAHYMVRVPPYTCVALEYQGSYFNLR